MRGLGTDHVISGPMTGFKKLHVRAQTDNHIDGHGDSMTESAPWGPFSEKNGLTTKYLISYLDHNMKKSNF